MTLDDVTNFTKLTVISVDNTYTVYFAHDCKFPLPKAGGYCLLISSFCVLCGIHEFTVKRNIRKLNKKHLSNQRKICSLIFLFSFIFVGEVMVEPTLPLYRFLNGQKDVAVRFAVKGVNHSEIVYLHLLVLITWFCLSTDVDLIRNA